MPSEQLPKRNLAIVTAVSLIREMTPSLDFDLSHDVDDILADLRVSLAGDPPLDDFNDHLKSGVRSLFGEIEAVTHSLTKAVLIYFDAQATTIANIDWAVLQERDYDAASDTISERTRRYSLARRFETSSRLFLQACGAPPAPRWSDDATRHFEILARARNRLTHPKRLEDLIVTPCFESFREVAVWFPVQAMTVLAAAAVELGLPRPEIPPPVTFPPLTAPMPRPESIFDHDFYRRLFSDPVIAIRYIGFFSGRLDDELRRAFDLCNAALSPPYEPLRVGRGIRRMVRAITTNVEGTIGFTSFFMRAVRFIDSEISIPA